MTAIALYRLKPDVVAAQEQDGQVLVIGQDGRKRTMTPEAFAQQYEPAETADVSQFLRRALPAGDPASEAPKPNGRRRQKKKAKNKAGKRAKKVARARTAPSHNGPKPRFDWERGRKMWDQGKDASEIAVALGCSEAAVYYRKKADGWPDRNGASRRRQRTRPPSADPSPPGRQARGRGVPKGRAEIRLTRHSTCGKITSTNPCENCHQTVAPAEIGNAT